MTERRVFYDERAKVYQRWALAHFDGTVSAISRYQTEAEANAAAGIEGGSTDPDYNPQNKEK